MLKDAKVRQLQGKKHEKSNAFRAHNIQRFYMILLPHKGKHTHLKLISFIGLHTGYLKTVLGSARNKQTMTLTFARCKKVLNCS